MNLNNNQKKITSVLFQVDFIAVDTRIDPDEKGHKATNTEIELIKINEKNPLIFIEDDWDGLIEAKRIDSLCLYLFPVCL